MIYPDMLQDVLEWIALNLIGYNLKIVVLIVSHNSKIKSWTSY